MTIPEPTSTRDLRTLFCERLRCPPAEFEKRAFRKCLYFQARMIAPLLRWFDHRWFERDLLFLQHFGNARNWQEVMAEFDAFHFREQLQPRFARVTLRLRVSARKASKIAGDLLPP